MSSETTVKTGLVTAEHGLNMRTVASGTAEIITSIPHNERVEIISTDGPEATIGGRTANWIHVKYNNQTGWVWGGFLHLD